MPIPGKSPKPPSRGRWIREVAPDRTKPEGVPPAAWLTVPLLICCCATCTFSPARKYQRASGVAKFSPEIATPDPLRSNLELFLSFLRSNRLAGAGRGSWTLPLLGAASRGSATQPPAQQAVSVGRGGTVTEEECYTNTLYRLNLFHPLSDADTFAYSLLFILILVHPKRTQHVEKRCISFSGMEKSSFVTKFVRPQGMLSTGCGFVDKLHGC